MPGGVADQSEFRPLTQLLQNIGQSNRDGSTPIDTYDLSEKSVKLLQDFMDKAGVPVTGESPKRAEILNTMQQTFGLSDKQVTGLLAKSLDGKDAFIPHPSQRPSSEHSWMGIGAQLIDSGVMLDKGPW